MLLRPGDLGYIPDGWWHLVKSHPGRNMALAIEFEPFARGSERLWPDDVASRYRWPGLFWAESVRIRYAMRERLGGARYPAMASGEPIRCEKLAPPALFADLMAQLGRPH